MFNIGVAVHSAYWQRFVFDTMRDKGYNVSEIKGGISDNIHIAIVEVNWSDTRWISLVDNMQRQKRKSLSIILLIDRRVELEVDLDAIFALVDNQFHAYMIIPFSQKELTLTVEKLLQKNSTDLQC